MSAEVIEGYPLSPQQRQIWRRQDGAQSTPYCAQATLVLDGALDGAGLRAALVLLVERHEILRTRFAHLPGLDLPLQVIAAPGAPSLREQALPVADLSPLPPLTFDWESGPLLHLVLARQSARRQQLHLRLPALCADRATIEQLGAELSRCYAAVVAGESLPAPAMQYADLSVWLEDLLSEPDAAAGRAVWAEAKLEGVGQLRLPSEGVVSFDSAFDPHCLTVPLPAPLEGRLRSLAGQQSCGLCDVLLAGWLGLLLRLTEPAELVVGVVGSGRPYAELATALGPLSKTVPLACPWEPTQPFTALLAQVSAQRQSTESWQLYFAEDQMSTTAPPGFFPLCFEYVTMPRPWQAGAVTFTLSEARICNDRYGVKLLVVEQASGLRTELHYDGHRFTPSAIAYLAEAYQTLLAQVTATPASALCDLPRLGPHERHQVLVAFNPRPADSPPPLWLHQRLEQIASCRPERLAVRIEDQTLTYADLNSRASQLAAELQQQGVGPEVCVVVYLERSLESLVALLAILKAGGVYVPLDPAWPTGRLAFVLADTQAPVILSERRLCERLPATPARVYCLDDLVESTGPATAPIFPPVSGTNLAYVLYTSGSTGQPKGVAISHQAVAHYLVSLSQRLAPGDDASFAVVSTLAADLAYTAVFAAWWHGGCVHLITPPRSRDPEGLAAYMEQHAVSGLKIVPSHLSALLSGVNPAALLPRRWLVLGGEALRWGLLDALCSLSPPCAIFNHYGPTETTIGVLTECLWPSPASRSATPTLGRPLAHSPVYLLDAALEPVPVGMVGDLYIGGLSLARGYLHRPDLTAAHFLPDPFACSAGARLYKTGDRARLLPDGRLEFVGRLDDQVKLRGYRIELAEVAEVLRQHPLLRQAVVLLRSEEGAEPQLVAYVVPSAESAPPLRELRHFMGTHLPAYMVPHAVIVLDELPLTVNGKVDWRALPAAQPSTAAADRPVYVPPRNDIEAVLTQLWSQLLQVERIGIHDNFFALGGHSLLATRLLSRLRSTFRNEELPLRLIFESPTVAELSHAIVANETTSGQTTRIARMLVQIEAMSDEEIRETLEQKRKGAR